MYVQIDYIFVYFTKTVLEASNPRNQEGSEGHYYEIIKEDAVVYDTTDGQPYAVVSVTRPPMEESDEDTYRKFTNPLYAEKSM